MVGPALLFLARLPFPDPIEGRSWRLGICREAGIHGAMVPWCPGALVPWASDFSRWGQSCFRARGFCLVSWPGRGEGSVRRLLGNPFLAAALDHQIHPWKGGDRFAAN